MTNKKQEEILKFALNELKKTIDNVKSGKPPAISNDLKNIFQVLKESYNLKQQNKLTDEDMENITEEMVKKINKEEK